MVTRGLGERGAPRRVGDRAFLLERVREPVGAVQWPERTRHGVDMELINALIAVESGFNDKARSPKGAVGLMQVMPTTAQRFMDKGLEPRQIAQRLAEPRTNIAVGTRVMADLLRRHRRIDVALAAWSAGEGAVQRSGGQMPEIGETRAHVHQVLELYWALLQRRQSRGAQTMRLHAAP